MTELTHAQALDRFFSLLPAWRIDEEREKCLAAASACIEQAYARVPCKTPRMSNYPLAMFIACHGEDLWAHALDSVFQAYTKNGHFALDTPLSIGKRAPNRFHRYDGLLPLEAAVRGGNIHAAELLIRYGAPADISSQGEEFLSFVDNHFGEFFALTIDPSKHLPARIRLTEAIMRRAIAPHEAAAGTEAAPRRRRATL